jgi:hypothetical protein
MQTSARALLAAMCLVAAACTSVFTVDDVITESTAIADDRLLGDWVMIDGKDRVHVARAKGNDYAVSYVDNEDSALFRVRLGRLGATLALDAYPDPTFWKARDESGIPTHLVFALEFSGDSIGIRGLKGDSVSKLLGRGELRVPYSRVFESNFGGGDLLLHGNPVDVRAALGKVFQLPHALEQAVWYRRARREGP